MGTVSRKGLKVRQRIEREIDFSRGAADLEVVDLLDKFRIKNLRVDHLQKRPFRIDTGDNDPALDLIA